MLPIKHWLKNESSSGYGNLQGRIELEQTLLFNTQGLREFRQEFLEMIIGHTQYGLKKIFFLDNIINIKHN